MLPIATTTIEITRAAGTPYEAAAATPVTSGVRAHISAPSGSEVPQGGAQEIVDATLTCDPCDVTEDDTVVCETTGQTYSVVWARKRIGLGLDHMTAGLRAVSGVA